MVEDKVGLLIPNPKLDDNNEFSLKTLRFIDMQVEMSFISHKLNTTVVVKVHK